MLSWTGINKLKPSIEKKGAKRRMENKNTNNIQTTKVGMNDQTNGIQNKKKNDNEMVKPIDLMRLQGICAPVYGRHHFSVLSSCLYLFTSILFLFTTPDFIFWLNWLSPSAITFRNVYFLLLSFLLGLQIRESFDVKKWMQTFQEFHIHHSFYDV